MLLYGVEVSNKITILKTDDLTKQIILLSVRNIIQWQVGLFMHGTEILNKSIITDSLVPLELLFQVKITKYNI